MFVKCLNTREYFHYECGVFMMTLLRRFSFLFDWDFHFVQIFLQFFFIVTQAHEMNIDYKVFGFNGFNVCMHLGVIVVFCLFGYGSMIETQISFLNMVNNLMKMKVNYCKIDPLECLANYCVCPQIWAFIMKML